MVEINPQRLLADLARLRSFGAVGSGVVRPTFSESDMEARAWLCGRMSEAGLKASIDGVGNVVGVSPNSGRALLIGSHSDTQPRGGWLDGALGVIYAIEIARTLLDQDTTSELAVDAVAWSDEEGSYLSCLGSRSFCGVLDPCDEQSGRNALGESVTEAIARVGLTNTERATLDADRHIGYLEAHIEQGPYLDASADRIGVVTSIVGIRSLHVTFDGQQNHAGTTPMNLRSDAAVAMFEYAVELGRRFAEVAAENTVWTFGDARVDPGAESIIAGKAHLVLQFRDQDDAILEEFEVAAQDLAAEMNASEKVTVVAARPRDPISPTVMDSHLRSAIATAALGRVSDLWTEMPSAAGHDPMIISHHIPCGMLFIPSIGGVSHDFGEDTSDEDIVMGCRVLADAAASILGP